MQYNPVFIYPKNEADAMDELLSIGATIDTERREQLLQSKRVIRAEGLLADKALELKGALSSFNQVCLLNESAEQNRTDQTDAIIAGYSNGIKKALKSLDTSEDEALERLAAEINDLLEREHHHEHPWYLQVGERTFDLNDRTWIMGILNVTPDSFSDGGRFNTIELAVQHAKEMVAHGADIIDIGGESTRPGYEKVSLEEELERVIPYVRAISKELDVPISIDTYKAEVARQAIQAGASIINDIWGAKADPKMAEVAADLQVPIILMHNRNDKDYDHLMSDMAKDLRESIDLVKAAGVKEENIILDPGIGFAKTYEDNLEVMNKLETITSLGYPVLLGTSRKGFIGKVLDTEADERVEGTGATTCLGIQKGCQIVRIHDVLENKRMALMMDAMLKKRRTAING